MVFIGTFSRLNMLQLLDSCNIFEKERLTLTKNILNLTGQRYGRFTVLNEANRKGKVRYWNCICDCKTKKTVRMSNLRNGTTLSCGCLLKEVREKRINDLTGKVFGKLTVLKISKEKSNGGNLIWDCRCSCGKVKSILSASLTSGKSESCGCMNIERGRDLQVLLDSEYKVNGVYVTDLKRKIYSNNRTGVKGVSIQNRKNGIVYRAIISVGNKKIHLGYFDDIENAKQARLSAEKEYHKPYIDKYEESAKGKF